MGFSFPQLRGLNPKEQLKTLTLITRKWLVLEAALSSRSRALLCPCIRRKGDPERAETFLQEALKSYVSEGWSLPVTHTRKQIAECQKLLGRTDEYP